MLLGLLAGAWFGRARVLAPPLCWLAAQQVEERFGAALSIGAIEGDWLRHLRLRDVRLEPGRGALPVVRRLNVPMVEVRWSLWDVVRGRLDGIEAIGLEAELVELDLTEATQEDTTDAAIELPALPALDVAVGELLVHLPGERRLAVEGLDWEHGILAEYGVALVAEVDYDDPELGDRDLSVELDGTWRDERLSIARLVGREQRFGAFSIADGSVDLSRLGAGELAVHAPLAIEDARLTTDVTVALEGGATTIVAAGSAIDLALLAGLPGLVPELPLAGVVDEVDARVEVLPGREPPVTIRGSVRGRDVAWEDYRADRLAGRVELAGETLRLDELRIERGDDRLSGDELVLPLARREPIEWLAAVRGRLTVDVRDARDYWPTNGGAAPPNEAVRVLVDTGWTADGIVVDSGEVTTRRGRAAIERGTFVWADTLATSRLDLSLSIDLPDLTELAIEGLAGGGEGTVRLTGPLEALTGHANLAAEVRYAELESGTVSVACDFDGRRARIEQLAVSGERVELSIAGSVGFDGGLEGLTVEGEVRELGHFVPGVSAGQVSIEGRFDGELRNPLGPFTLAGSGLDGFDALGRVVDEVTIEGRLFRESVALQRLSVASPHGSIEATGDVRWDAEAGTADALIGTLVARNEEAELGLAAPMRIVYTPDSLTVGPGVLRGAGGRAELVYVRNPDEHRGRLELSDFDPFALVGALLPRGFASEGVDGAIEIDLSGEPRIDANLIARGLRPPGAAGEEAVGASGWTVELHAALADGRIEVPNARARHARWGRFALTGAAPFDGTGSNPWAPGPVDLDLDVERFDVGAAGRLWEDSSLSGVFTGGAELSGTWDELVGRIAIATRDARLVGAGGEAIGPGSIDLELDVQPDATTGSLAITGLENLTFEGSGSVARGLDVPRIVRAPEELLSAELDASVELEVASLAPFGRWLESLPSSEGRVRAQGRLIGTLTEPRFAGQVRLSEGRVRAAADLPPLEALEGYLTFSEDRVVLNGLHGELGAAPFELSGSVELREPGPVCDLSLSGENLLLQRRRGFKLRADAELRLAGALDELQLSGTMALTDGRFTKSFDPFSLLDPRDRGGSLQAKSGLDFSISSDPFFGPTRLDVQVTAKDAFVIKNNIVKGGLRPDLRLRGTAEVPYLVGPLYVDSTRVVLPAGRLELRSGTVSFLRADPFRPEIELNGEAFVRGYRIDVRIDGSIDDPEVTLSSTPALASEDALVLIVTGQLPANVASTEAVQTVALFLAQDFVQRWFASESTEDDESFLERIDVWSGVDPIKTGVETYHVSLRLAGDPDEPGLVQSIQGEQDAYEHFNFGYRFLFKLR